MTEVIKFQHTYLIAAANAFPQKRLLTPELAKTRGWLNNPGRSLAVNSKTQAELDEDSLTLAYQAAKQVVVGYEDKIAALYLGSESPVYAVKPEVTLLVEFLSLRHDIFGADIEFACRAGIEAVMIASNLIEAGGGAHFALAIGADTAQARPGDVLEMTASAAASAWLLADQPQGSSYRLLAASSYISDTPDFWRHQEDSYPGHGGRFTGQPAYFYHLEKVYHQLTSRLGFKNKDFSQVAIHAPNFKFPDRLAHRLGFQPHQYLPLLVDDYGNPYTASVMVQSVVKLQRLKTGQKLLVLSFGSGAGSVALVLEKVSQKEKK